MTTYRTGNPLGSKDPRDLYDNAENFDAAINDVENPSFEDRFGRQRTTLKGYDDQFQQFLLNSGYENVGDYGPGLEITARNQIFWRDGELYRAGAALELPYTTTGDWATEGSMFVGVGDALLRQDLARTDRVADGDALIGVRQPFLDSVKRTQHEKNLDHITSADFGIPAYPVDSSSYFELIENSEEITSVDLLGQTYVVDGILITKNYYNGNIKDGNRFIVHNIDKFRRIKNTLPIGPVSLPTGWDNRLGLSVFYDGKKFNFNSLFGVADWAYVDTPNSIFVSYLNGDDIGGDGSEALPYKSMGKAFAEAMGGNTIIKVMDRLIPRQASGHVHRDSTISFDKNIKIMSVHESGESIVGNFGDQELLEWTKLSGSNAYTTTTGEVRAVYDLRLRDQKNIPTPLVLVSSINEVKEKAGSFFVDGSSVVYVHMHGGRNPKYAALVCSSVGSWHFNIPADGQFSMQGIKTIFPYALQDGVRITPRFTDDNTAIVATKDCAFIGSDFNGITTSRVRTVVHENGVAAYTARDGFSYGAGVNPSLSVIYELGCVSYENGSTNTQINPSNTGSDNGSTAHNGLSIVRVDCEHLYAKNGIVADVNGCFSLNIGVSSGSSLSPDQYNKASFVFNDVGAVNPSRVYLIGCSGGNDDTFSISTEGDGSIDIIVDGWNGVMNNYQNVTIRDIDGNIIGDQ